MVQTSTSHRDFCIFLLFLLLYMFKKFATRKEGEIVKIKYKNRKLEGRKGGRKMVAWRGQKKRKSEPNVIYGNTASINGG